MRLKRFLFSIFLVCQVAQISSVHHHRHISNSLDLIFQWKLLEFGFDSQADYDEAIREGYLIPSHAIPVEVDTFYRDGRQEVLVAIPRFGPGIPFSLATVTAHNGTNGAILKAYPSYDWHRSHGENCDGITSAFRVVINACHEMWVLDAGVIGSEQKCPPQLLLFDLKSSALKHRYRFTEKVYTPGRSLLITPIAVVHDPPPMGKCSNTMIYIADTSLPGLVVYNHQRNVAWRIEHPFMQPDPLYVNHTIAGTAATIDDGIFGLSTEGRHLYFHPLASIMEYRVPLNILDNQALWSHGHNAAAYEFHALGRRQSPCASEVINSHGRLYCVTFTPITLMSWNIRKRFNHHNFKYIPLNANWLEFVAGIKVKRNRQGREELWMLSNRFQKFASETQNFDEVNFRIMRYQLT